MWCLIRRSSRGLIEDAIITGDRKKTGGKITGREENYVKPTARGRLMRPIVDTLLPVTGGAPPTLTSVCVCVCVEVLAIEIEGKPSVAPSLS